MSHLEEAILRRYPGRTILVFGVAVVIIGVLPLLLYIVAKSGPWGRMVSRQDRRNTSGS